MSTSLRQRVGLEVVLEALARRYAFDDVGRITGSLEQNEGRTPRFVLGRAREGVLWRFRSDLDPTLLVEIGRLAAREKGFPIGIGAARPPERLASIAKLLARHDRALAEEGGRREPHGQARAERQNPEAPIARHALVSADGVVMGELFAFD